MKLERFTLRNWRQHQRLELRLAPVTLITGGNNAGKTGIRAAIEMLQTGFCEFTDDTGNDFGQLRTAGCDESWSLSAELDTGYLIIREEKSLHVGWAPQATSKKAAQDALNQAFGGRGPDTVRLALRAGRFFGFDGSKRKTMLGRLLDLEVTTDRVVAELKKLGLERKLPLLEAARDKVGMSGLAAIERAYKAVYDARTGANRALKDAGTRRDALEEEGKNHVWVSKEDGLALAAREESLYTELSELAGQIGALKQRLAEWDRAAASGDAHQAGATGLQEQLDSLEIGPAPDADRAAEVERLTADLQGQLADLAAYQKSKGTLEITISRLQTTAARLRKDLDQAGGCQWAPESPCAGAEKRKAETQRELAEVERQLEDSTVFLLELTAPSQSAEAIRAQLNDLNAESSKLRRQAATRSTLLTERAKLAERIAQANQRLTVAQASKAEADRERPGVEAKLAELEQLRTSKAQLAADLREELAAARLAHAHKSNMDKARDAFAKAEQEQACLEELCNFFHPSGFPARLLIECLDPFVRSLNEILAPFDLVADYQNLELTVSRGGGAKLPYSVLSDSDRIIVGLAHQVGFAVLSHVGIVVLDQVEALDQTRQQILIEAAQLIRANTNGLDHILILCVHWLAGVPHGVQHVKLPPNLTERERKQAEWDGVMETAEALGDTPCPSTT